MQPTELCLRALESAFRDGGHECARSAAAVTLPSLNLEIRTYEPEVHPPDNGRNCLVMVTFGARSIGANGPGICVFAVGFGATESTAARDAASAWITGVFPALRTYLKQPEHLCEVMNKPMLVSVPETGEHYGWVVHAPPITMRWFGRSDFSPETKPGEMYSAIITMARRGAAHNTPFWLECYVLRYPDGSIDSTCRYNNTDWPEGKETLINWASAWTEPGGFGLSKRQFLLFEPVSLIDSRVADEFQRQMKQERSVTDHIN